MSFYRHSVTRFLDARRIRGSILEKLRSCTLAWSLLLPFSSNAYGADSSVSAVKSKPLSGHVTVLDAPTRLTRDDIDFSANPKDPDSGGNTNSSQGAAMQPQLDQGSVSLLRGFADSKPKTVLQSNAVANQSNPPYIWSQNFSGGYTDQTGHYKGVVWGDHLREYGGHFYDGTPVPDGPVQINQAGHIFWQPQLSGMFWTKKN